jgi:hypothetical protein
MCVLCSPHFSQFHPHQQNQQQIDNFAIVKGLVSGELIL